MPDVIPFISTADLTAFLGSDVTTAPMAPIALDSACQIVRSYIGQRLNYLADDTVVLDGLGHYAILLPELPVVEVTEVLEDDVEVDAADYFVSEGGLLRKKSWGHWAWGLANVTVTYSHGYAFEEADVDDPPGSGDPTTITRMPSDIRAVALSIAKRIFEAGAIASGGVTGETIGGYSYTLNPGAAGEAGALLEGEKQILGFYAERRVA